MEYVWTHAEERIPGVEKTLVCDGGMYALEVQVQEDRTVIATAWKPVPATFWEPGDMDCVIEKTYKSLNAAKRFLEKFDDEALTEERKYEVLIEQQYKEWQAALILENLGL